VATVTLRKVGNSLGVTIPADVIARGRLAPGQQFTVVETEDGFRMVRGGDDFERQLALAMRVLDENALAMELLAKA
jgi:putative addiction module antidote